MTDWVGEYESPQSAVAYCGKRGYDSQTAAQAALLCVTRDRRRKSHGKRREVSETVTYRCQKCGRWHMTSMGW